ncbi:MAG: [protein-PII] uridylyltransferase [Alphaproteobacteria bacterium]|nr:[protein-PII] uridylyltransferase [Alphaproteobacteria bacterium]
MSTITTERSLAERHDLSAALAALYEAAGRDARTAHAPILARLKVALEDGRAAIVAKLEKGARGPAVTAAMSALIDRVVGVLLHHASERVFPLPNPTRGDRLTLIAVGGYGRAELAPNSDLDLLFLHPYKITPQCEQVIEFVLYALWDLGLKVGHAVRSLEDAVRRAKADMSIRTALLEMRFIAGDAALHAELRARFWDEVVPGDDAAFVAAKLAERDERHRRMGDSRYLLEPNVKDGKGGLRDLHTLSWIAKYLYRIDRFGELIALGVVSRAEHARFVRAEAFLLTVRCHLHSEVGRAEDRLTFDLQPAIARRMGYADRKGSRAVERFMKHYFLIAKSVGELTRVLCAALEGDRLKPRPVIGSAAWFGPELDGFRVEGGRVLAARDEVFGERPVRLVRLFRIAQQMALEIHPSTLRLVHESLRLITPQVRQDQEANNLFLALLTDRRDPETALRRMNEAGVLGRFVPDFGRVVAQTQQDMYHAYTVDEHSVRAIGVLARIESGALAAELPLASEIVRKPLSRNALYLATFLHDVAKGRGSDHSVEGEQVARLLGPRLGLSAADTELTAWLVRWHLLFSGTAFKRDVNDSRTVANFAAQVESIERLRLLLVLTAADIYAVGPGRWNNWRGSLLRALYYRTEERLTGGHMAEASETRTAAAQAALRAALHDWLAADIEAHVARLPPAYWLSTDLETQVRHARLARDAAKRGQPLAVDTIVHAQRSVTEITILADDHPGLFAAVAGAIAMAGASIVDAKAFTGTDGLALDTFFVQGADGDAFDDDVRLARMVGLLESALAGEVRLERALGERPWPARRLSATRVEPRVQVDNEVSSRHTVIELVGRDRPGFLHDVARALTSLGLSIVSAHISTYGDRAVDVFYVKDRFGFKVTRAHQVERVRASLLDAIAEPTMRFGAAAAG